MNNPTDYAEELRIAYSHFATSAPLHEKLALDALLVEAHEQAGEVLAGRRTHVDHPHLSMVWSMLHPGPDAHEAKQLSTSGILPPPHVDGHGGIWSRRKYEQEDPGWSEVLVQFLKYRDNKATFHRKPQIIQIPDVTTLALVGDWGTGYWRTGTGAEGVATQVKSQEPDYTIHLGDVYYAGTLQEETDEFLALWPIGTLGSFALNSNHDMYSGGHAYFESTLVQRGFAQQAQTSYFALHNSNWVVIGLDSAYYSSQIELYKAGTIDAVQGGFLGQVGLTFPDHRVIVLTHHEGFNLTGDQKNALWEQVIGALGRVPDYWYWGHEHNAVVYKPESNCLCRCLGHGAIPYGAASDLVGAPAVEWYETKSAGDIEDKERVLNGYVLASLKNDSLTERFCSEKGEVRWP